MKYLLGFLFTCIALSSSGAIADVAVSSPNLIPPECKGLAMSFIIAGKDDYDSTRVGARLWSLARLEKAMGQNPSESACLNKIWEQANHDASDYWKHIAKKYHCLDDADLNVPDPPPPSCPSEKSLDIANNINYLNVTQQLHEAAHSENAGNCGPSSNQDVSSGIKHLMRQVIPVAHIAAQQTAKETQLPTIDTHMSAEEILGGKVALSDANDIRTCRLAALDDKGYLDESKLQTKYQSEEYKKNHPNESTVRHVVDDIADCGRALITNLLRSIWDDIKGLAKLAWSVLSAPVTDAIRATKAEIKLVKALSNGASIGAIVRQEYTDSGGMKKKLEDYLNQAYVALKSKLSSEYTQFGCFNQKGNTEKVCSIVGYLGPDVIMLIPGFQELAITKLEEIPKIGEAIRFARLGTAEVTGVVGGLSKAAVKLGADVVKQILGRPLKWVMDITSGLREAVFGTDVVLQDAAGNFYKAQPNVKDRIMAALDKKFLPKGPVVSEPPSLVNYWNNKGIIQQTIDTTKTVAQNAWKKVSPEEGRAKALAKNAENASKNVAELPKDYLVPDSNLTHSDPNLVDVSSDPYRAAKKAEQKQAADFLNLTDAPAESNGVRLTNKFIAKDASGASKVFYRVQHEDGNWYFDTEETLKLPQGKTGFPVYVNVDPEKMAQSLPEVIKLAKASGSGAIQVSADASGIVKGNRLTVWMDDPFKAKTLMKKLSAKSSLGAVRNATVKSQILKISQKTAAIAAITKCGVSHDHQCYCHYYSDIAGLNPTDGQAIEISPFRCSSDADAQTAMDAAIKIYQKDHPPGAAPEPGAPVYQKQLIPD